MEMNPAAATAAAANAIKANNALRQKITFAIVTETKKRKKGKEQELNFLLS